MVPTDVSCARKKENLSIMFLSYVLSPKLSVWKVVLHIVNERKKWDKNTLLDYFESWMIEKSLNNHSAMPCYVIWGLALKE